MTMEEFAKRVPPEQFIRLIELVEKGVITRATAKQVLRIMCGQKE